MWNPQNGEVIGVCVTHDAIPARRTSQREGAACFALLYKILPFELPDAAVIIPNSSLQTGETSLTTGN